MNGSSWGPGRDVLAQGFRLSPEGDDRQRVPRSPSTPSRPASRAKAGDDAGTEAPQPTTSAGTAISASSPESPPPVSGEQRGRRTADDLVLQLAQERQLAPQSWWRRMLKLQPEPQVVARDEALRAMRSTFGRPVTIAVASPKGGGGKTPTTIGLSGAFGTARHGGVAAWDNNETRGTLLDRLEVTNWSDVGELTRHSEYFLSPEASINGLERAMNRQADGEFMALGSDQARGTSRIPAAEVDLVHRILSRFFSIIVIDCGNNEGAENHIAALNLADVLVVPIKWRRDSVHPAQRMLDRLREDGYPLDGRTIIVASNKPGDVQDGVKPKALPWFEESFPVLEVPFDPVLDSEPIRWSQLAERTQDAYRTIGAGIAQSVLAQRPAAPYPRRS